MVTGRRPAVRPGAGATRHRVSFSGRRGCHTPAGATRWCLIHIIDHVSGLGIVVARLADGADVDEILLARLDLEFGVGAASHDAVADEGDRHMGVAEKADRGVLVSEAGGRRQLVEHITPALRAVQGGMDEGEIDEDARVFQLAQPLFVIVGQLPARPPHRLGGGRIESLQRPVARAILVMVALDARDA